MKEAFIDWNPKAETLATIVHADTIMKEYSEKWRIRLTLRQLYYQLVSRDIIPNSLRSYSRLGDIVSKGRLAGYLDWSMIEDRIRIPKANQHWNSAAQILRSAASSFYKDRWEGQENYVEVWCEKDAVSNIIEPVCSKWDVIFMANRGYSSQSAMYSAYGRYQHAHFQGKDLHLIYFGDHDPSGIDMTRDIQDRMDLFLGFRESVAEEYITLDVDRAALNMNQVDEYHPPENPAKTTDSRYESYVSVYGDSSWELDALSPDVLSGIVEAYIVNLVDIDAFDAVEHDQEKVKAKIQEVADNWTGE